MLGFQTSGTLSVTGTLDFVTNDNQAGVYLDGLNILVHTDTGGIAPAQQRRRPAGQLDLRGRTIGRDERRGVSGTVEPARPHCEKRSARSAQWPGERRGALSARTIQIAFDNGLYIQNSGTGTAYADRRGFTAESLTLNSGEGVREVAINGRLVNPQGGFFTGLDTAAHIDLNDGPATSPNGVNPLSTINGLPHRNELRGAAASTSTAPSATASSTPAAAGPAIPCRTTHCRRMTASPVSSTAAAAAGSPSSR